MSWSFRKQGDIIPWLLWIKKEFSELCWINSNKIYIVGKSLSLKSLDVGALKMLESYFHVAATFVH